MSNIFADIPESLSAELTQQLASAENVRIERIVSQGHHSDSDHWYDQDDNEFVLLVQGAATLEFEHETISLEPGDWIEIPAHQRHRIVSTKLDEQTIWLVVFYS